MSKRYLHLLSPVQVGQVLFKNRMMSTAATPHYLQGVEGYPTEKWITHMANRAKNGASAVYINHIERGNREDIGLESVGRSQPGHFSAIDQNNASAHNYLCQMIDTIRTFGSIAVTQAMGEPFRDPDEPPPPEKRPDDDGFQPHPQPHEEDHRDIMVQLDHGHLERGLVVNKMTKRDIQAQIDSTVKQAKLFKQLGFEMLSQQNAYLCGQGANFFSPLCNHRTDEYGGSTKNRARYLVELYDALKQELGRDFPLECIISGYETSGGATIQDTIELAGYMEGVCDILHIRYAEQDPQHPTGFTSTRQHPCPNVDAAAAIKESVSNRGGKLLVAVSAGLQDPDYSNRLIADGKADIIAMARAFICDSEFGKKVYEGRGEDITPCVRCNKCHTNNESERYRSYCTVNPVIGLEDKLDRMIAPVERLKKVAVIGGGPAGIYAATACAQRGHRVTIFEKEGELGGQLVCAKYPSFKWPLEDYRRFIIKKLYSSGVEVRLNTAATREMLEPLEFDEVIVAIGPRFVRPDIPGAQGSNTMLAVDVYGNEKSLPGNIVVIGGSEIGVETGMYLAETGHDVTVMTRNWMLAEDAAHAHYISMLTEAYRAMDNFHELTEVTYEAIDSTGVTYVDKSGNRQHIAADLIVLATGAVTRPQECADLYGAGENTHYIGDCIRVANVHRAVTEAFGIANQI